MPSLKSVVLMLALAAAPLPLLAQSPATTVILVRHAEKADEPGADPALSAAGEARARALADALRDVKVAAVLTTPYRRTNATGQRWFPRSAGRGCATCATTSTR
jgi:hypothetical protein